MELPYGTVLEILKLKKIPFRRSGNSFKVKCPFHNDKHPSASVDPERNTFICFACGETLYENWKSIQGIKSKQNKAAIPSKALFLMLGHSEKEWKKFVRKRFQRANTEKMSEMEKVKKDSHLSKEILDFWRNNLNTEKKPVIDYLLSRKINPHYLLKKQEIKILNDKKYKKFKSWPILIPTYNTKKELVGIQMRSLSEKNNPKAIMLPGSQPGYFGLKSFQKQNFTIITEGSTDFLTLKSQGVNNVIGLFNTLTPIDKNLELYLSQKIIFFFHNDKAGIRLLKKFKRTFPSKEILAVSFLKKESGDLNDIISENQSVIKELKKYQKKI